MDSRVNFSAFGVSSSIEVIYHWLLLLIPVVSKDPHVIAESISSYHILSVVDRGSAKCLTSAVMHGVSCTVVEGISAESFQSLDLRHVASVKNVESLGNFIH